MTMAAAAAAVAMVAVGMPTTDLCIPATCAAQPPQQPSVERLYYVLDGVVYQVPNLHALFSSRLQKLGWHLDGAFEACWAAARGEEQPTELDAAPTSQLR